MEILSYWRTSHASALESAFDLLENITNKIDKYALLAKRLKRTPSIVNKLKRFNSKGMQLSTMQDIGGCRIILSNLKNIDRLIKTLKKERLFELRNDYITQLSHLKPSSFPVTSLNRSIMAVKFSFLLTTSSILAISSKIAKNACIAIAKV